MRELNKEEFKTVVDKLSIYCGKDIESKIAGSEDRVMVFVRMNVHLVARRIYQKCTIFPAKKILAIGVKLGKITRMGKFRISITAIDFLSQYATRKIWIKPEGEPQFSFGNHVIRRHVGRMHDRLEARKGVLVMNMGDIPLGFGVTTMDTDAIKKSSTERPVIIHQGDVGEYLRDEARIGE